MLCVHKTILAAPPSGQQRVDRFISIDTLLLRTSPSSWCSSQASGDSVRAVATSLPGVVVIEPDVFADERGFFLESYHRQKFAALGIDCDFVQDNHSRSSRETLRGLHYQLKFPQAKLCRVVEGEVLDVVVDIRRGSPSFGQSVSVVLSADNFRQIFVPRGFAHGFVTRSETAQFLYKCSDFYHPEFDRGILWSDPDLRIEWDVATPLVSSKDQRHPRLKDVAESDLPVYTK